MSRECELTGTKPMVGHIVSHSQIKTKRRYLPNLVQVTLHSEMLDQNFKLRIAAKALRTVDKLGGLDAFLAKAKEATKSHTGALTGDYATMAGAAGADVDESNAAQLWSTVYLALRRPTGTAVACTGR